MARSINTRLDRLEAWHGKQRTQFVWADTYKTPTQYTTRGGEITADKLASLEADPRVKVVMFRWGATVENG